MLRAHGGRTALEYKYDGARMQLHRDGDRVAIWTRRLSDVTRSLPDVVGGALATLDGAPFILDGEVVALDAAGRPLPFQELMRRFRRVHGVEALVREMPLALHFFDCLIAEGRSLIDEPYAERWEALTAVTGGRYLAERAIVDDDATARAFHARALAAGHEGVMAKDLRRAYEPGGRGKRWFKLKAAETRRLRDRRRRPRLGAARRLALELSPRGARRRRARGGRQDVQGPDRRRSSPR